MSKQIQLGEPARLAWKAFFVAQALLLEKIEGALEESGVGSLVEYDALYTIASSPEGEMEGKELVASMTLSQSGLSRLLSRLESRGWIVRKESPTDRRAYRVSLTGQGKEALERLWEVYADAIEKHFAQQLSASDLDHVVKAMRKVIGPLADAREQAHRAPFLHRV